MKAIVQSRYGLPDVLGLQEVDNPAVDDYGVLVRVRAASVNPLDWHLCRGKPYIARLLLGLRRPKTPIRGVDVAGIVEAVGRNVKEFQPGDEVFGMKNSAFAEYVCGKERHFVRKPARITFEQAAAVPVAAETALQGLRDKGQLRAGQKALINGASGGIGTFAVQIAKALGAEVTGVTSTRNVDLVRSLGADRVLDYTEEDFTRTGERYDVILDNAGTRSRSECRRVLAPNGTLVLAGQSGRETPSVIPFLTAGLAARFMGRQKLVSFISNHRKEDLLFLRDLMEAGKLTPVVDRTYPLRDVPEAIRYVGTGHARAKVVITVE